MHSWEGRCGLPPNLQVPEEEEIHKASDNCRAQLKRVDLGLRRFPGFVITKAYQLKVLSSGARALAILQIANFGESATCHAFTKQETRWFHPLTAKLTLMTINMTHVWGR